MKKIVNVEKIVNEMELKEDMCFTTLERTLLEIAVLKGALAVLDNERKEIQELVILRAKHEPKSNWVTKVLGYNPFNKPRGKIK